LANSKITNLTSLTPATGDEIPVNRSGSDGKITVGGIQTPLLADVQADGNNIVFEDGDGFYNPSAKGYDAKVLVFRDGTSNDGNNNYGYLEIANGDFAEEVQIRAKNGGAGLHVPIALVPLGTDGVRIRWGDITTVFPKLELTSTSSNNAAPFLLCSKYSASPAAADFVGGMECNGYDSGAGVHIFGGLWFRAYAVTAGAEYGYATFATCVNGTDEVEQAHFGDGVVIGASVSAWPGQGSLRLTSLQVGHDTDTTVTRNAAGELAIEGKKNYHAGNTPATIGITIDGGGSAITTGVKGYVTVPYACTITEWYLTGDTSGAIKIDVWREDFAGGVLPDDSDSITNANEPEITASGVMASDTDLANWTSVTIAANDIIGFNVDSCTSITKATLVLKVLK
jgi:hypothetical protein